MKHIIFFILITAVFCQPKCWSSGIPAQLPALIDEHVLLDMNRYFEGPNLTLTMTTSSPIITLDQKYSLSAKTHNLGNIVSIKVSNYVLTMLGVSTTGKFNIYFASALTPHNLTAKQVPSNLKNCFDHAVSPNGDQVSLTCQNKDTNLFVIAQIELTDKSQWVIHGGYSFVIVQMRKIVYLQSDYVAVLYKNQTNSYIQIWNVKYGRIVGVYERTFFALQKLKLMDIGFEDGLLYILDYESGVYKLKFAGEKLTIVQVYAMSYYSKLAISFNTLIVARKGSVTQYGDRVFKYQSSSSEIANNLIVSQSYIIVYAETQTTVYLRGLHTPYLIIPFQKQTLTGVFISANSAIQCVSDANSPEVSIQDISFSHPYVKIPSLAPSEVTVHIYGVSEMNGLFQNCSINFSLIRTSQENMQIFQNTNTRNGTEHIYMNRPGKAEIDLTPYALGPDLDYNIDTFSQSINLTHEIRKVRKVPSLMIQGIQNLFIKAAHFSNQCGLYSTQCPLAVETEKQDMLRYFGCKTFLDRASQANKIECTQKHRQFKFSDYIHFDIEQTDEHSQYFFEYSVTVDQPNTFSIRKFKMLTINFGVVYSLKTKIYPQQQQSIFNQITRLEFNQKYNLIYILVKNKKQILIYSLTENGDNVQFKYIFSINSNTFGGLYFAPQTFEIDGDGVLWVKVFDQLIVIDARNVRASGKVKILNSFHLNKYHIKSYDYTFSIVEDLSANNAFLTDPKLDYTSFDENRRYLLLTDINNTIISCSISQTYDIDLNQLQDLPRYGFTLPTKASDRFVQGIGGSQVFVTLKDEKTQNSVHVIYDLSAITLVSSFYQSIETKPTSMIAYFHLNSQNPLIVFLQPTLKNTTAFSYQISSIPKLLLQVTNMQGQTTTQNMIIRAFNNQSSLRHSVVLGISNSAQKLNKGKQYPYHLIYRQATQKYIEIDCNGWVSGNVLNISYACQDCVKPETNQEPFIDIKGKIWQKNKYGIATGVDFVAFPEGSQMIGIASNNVIYTFNTSTQEIRNMFILSQSPQDIILKFAIHPQHHFIAAMIRSESGVNLVAYSTISQHGFLLSTLPLPPSVDYVLNMEYQKDVLAFLDFDNVYIVSFDNMGNSFLVDYFSELESGGPICWVELIGPNNATQQYQLLITLCSQSLTYIAFSLEENGTIMKISNKQTLNLKQTLNKMNVRLPTDSTFRSTKSRLSGSNLLVIMVVSNFHSIQWLFEMKNGVIITKVSVTKLLNRYEDFAALGDLSLSVGSQYLCLTYYNTSQYIHAIYDLTDDSTSQYTYKNIYIMQSFTSASHTRPKFITSNLMLAFTDDTHYLRNLDIANKFRAVIWNEQLLYSQSVFVIPHTPVSSISIEVGIKGIDIVVWEAWEIFLLIVGIGIGIGIGTFVFKTLFGKYQQRKKLVPLLVDYAEYEDDMAQQIEQKRTSGQIIGNINSSDRGSLPNPN